MPVGAAVAAAGIGGALISSSAAKSAANTQSNAANQSAQYQLQAAREAAQLQLGMFNTIRDDFAPYRAFGQQGLSGIGSLLGFPGQPPTFASSSAYGQQPSAGPAPSPVSAPGGLVIPGINGPATTGAPAVALPTVGTVNWSQVLKDRPDVLAEYNRVMAQADRNSPQFQKLGLDRGPEGFAEYWYNNIKPASEAYSAPTWTQNQITQLYPPSPTGPAPGTAPGTGAPQLPGGGAQPAMSGGGIQQYLENLPGYQFAKQQGMQAVENQLSARGLGGLSGSLGKGLARFVTGLADSTYQQQLDRMFQVSGIGSNAAAQTGSFGTQAASGASSNIVGGAQAVGNGMINSANASAAGRIASANAIGSGFQNAADGYITSRVLGMYTPQSSAAFRPTIPATTAMPSAAQLQGAW
jgi:hypothetical protein